MAKISNMKEQPKEVNLAVKLLLTSLVLGGLASILMPSVLPANVPAEANYYFIFLILLINGYIFYKIMMRRNWARILFIFLTIVGLPFSIPRLISAIAAYPLPGLLQIINMIIQLIAIYLLLKKESKSWFSNR
ncbi:MAG: hypothetical protein GX434_03380 [Peptococcaceae bacterium]|nr:hypothetical protein [Peptococcaceae bacterium]